MLKIASSQADLQFSPKAEDGDASALMGYIDDLVKLEEEYEDVYEDMKAKNEKAAEKFADQVEDLLDEANDKMNSMY